MLHQQVPLLWQSAVLGAGPGQAEGLDTEIGLLWPAPTIALIRGRIKSMMTVLLEQTCDGSGFSLGGARAAVLHPPSI